MPNKEIFDYEKLMKKLHLLREKQQKQRKMRRDFKSLSREINHPNANREACLHMVNKLTTDIARLSREIYLYETIIKLHSKLKKHHAKTLSQEKPEC